MPPGNPPGGSWCGSPGGQGPGFGFGPVCRIVTANNSGDPARPVAYVLAMSRAYVRPFHADDIPAAGALLAARHRAHRLSCRLLSPRYEHESAATAEVAAAFALPGASGAVAVQGGSIAGFLLGAPKDSPVWGSNVWVEAAGQAAAAPELGRDMCGLAAARGG